jgi:hypothetical protein
LDFFIDNLAIISIRWPEVAQKVKKCHFDLSQIELVKDHELSLVFDKIQVASSYNQREEAKLQISALPIYTANVTLYGTGLGGVQSRLLENTQLKLLHVVVFNISLFKASLTYFDHKKWLLDSRVNLSLPQKNSKVENPFIALPAELVLATNESASLRDRLCLALDDNFIRQNKGIGNRELQESIMSNLSFIKNDHDVQELCSNYFFVTDNNSKKTDFIVCGAGPTLADHFTWLQHLSTRERFIIVAVDAAVMPLAQAGIIADIVVSIDPVAKKLFDKLNLDNFNKVPLVYFPVVSGELLSLWQGPKYTAYSTGELYQEINDIHPKRRLYCAGSVIHPAVDLSVKMAAKNVLLLGADFSFPDGKSHTYWQDENSNNSMHLSTEKTSHWVLNSLNERVPTLLNYRGYLRDLEDYIELIKGVDFYNGSSKGALIRGTKLWRAL